MVNSVRRSVKSTLCVTEKKSKQSERMNKVAIKHDINIPTWTNHSHLRHHTDASKRVINLIVRTLWPIATGIYFALAPLSTNRIVYFC